MPKIVCSPSGICINYDGINVCYDGDSHNCDEMTEAVQKANCAAGEIYSLLEAMNFFA